MRAAGLTRGAKAVDDPSDALRVSSSDWRAPRHVRARHGAHHARARAAFALGAILALVSLASGADARETSPEIRLSEGAARRLLAAHQYRMRDKVPLYANKAGPFHNPSEVRRALVSRALSGAASDPIPTPGKRP